MIKILGIRIGSLKLSSLFSAKFIRQPSNTGLPLALKGFHNGQPV